MAELASWTDARRRIVAKTLFDIVKIQVGALYASQFFAAFAIGVKVALVAVMIATGLGAFVLYPKKEGERANG